MRVRTIVIVAFVIAVVVSPTSASSASSLRQLFLRILEPAAAATLSDNSTIPSTTTARPLPLPNPDGGIKSSSLVSSNNMLMTSSSSSLSSSVARESCTPPNPRTGELGSSPSLSGLRLPPPPSTDGSIVPLPAYSPAPVSCTGTCTTETVPGAPVDRSFAAAIRGGKIKAQALAWACESAAYVHPSARAMVDTVMLGYHKAEHGPVWMVMGTRGA
ncbi:hypothetical protein EDB84DRAFT_1198118 [Lactarius hengduanensis]|nr:hypothetical protein EDB84DRAFT_1198118 [Lactarius hengduanensis]